MVLNTYMGLTSTVVNYSRQLNNTFDKFTSIAGGALCLGRSLISILQSPGGAVAGLAQIITNQIIGGIQQFRGFLQYQLDIILYSTFGVISSIQQTVFNIANSITSIFNIVINTINNLTNRIIYLRGIISGQENCQQITAYMISCFINKTKSITNDKKTLRMLSDIRNLDESTSNLLGDIFKKDDFTRFVDKYENEAYKIQTQITKINQIL